MEKLILYINWYEGPVDTGKGPYGTIRLKGKMHEEIKILGRNARKKEIITYIM